jgi:hypothetical protein
MLAAFFGADWRREAARTVDPRTGRVLPLPMALYKCAPGSMMHDAR